MGKAIMKDIDGWRPGEFGAVYDSLSRLRGDACNNDMPVLAIAYGRSLLRMQSDHIMRDLNIQTADILDKGMRRLTPPFKPQ